MSDSVAQMASEDGPDEAIPALASRGHATIEELSIQTIHKVICGYIREEGDDLSMRQIAVLVQIAQGPLGITSIAEALLLSLSTVSRSIDALERLKLAKRQRSGRHVTAMATPLGSAKIGRLMANAMPQRQQ